MNVATLWGSAAVFAVAALSADSKETRLVSHFGSRAQTLTGAEYRVLRMEVDLTGDGEPELLLALSDRIPWWFVYQRITTGQYRFLGHLSFSPLAFRVDPNPPRLVMEFWQPGEGARTEIMRFDGMAFVDCQPRDTAACRDTGEDFAAWRKRVALRVWWTGLANLGEVAPEWHDYLDPGSPARAGGLLDLTVVE